MEKIFKEIRKERALQNGKWGIQKHNPEHWMVILMEEVGEACSEICGMTKNFDKYRKELVQVAAVAVAALEDFDENWKKGLGGA